ncbi:TIGR03086 family protein [Actinomadura sp. KC216]|uniref:TIGR03086 family metal-binding protein n=1 Tax=Actinomadura sp. KC216 TaxID=2530370 RepID=UPI001045DD12|nr:TIGR03086 family metal-binding protein [Actinomadura sp. KC216]TDB84950.1 TIGR03086 family protein [Actinomadura sp. KC216]
MDIRNQMLPAAMAAVRIVRQVPGDLMDAPTPCPEWDVRALINHLVLWTGRGETAARKLPPDGPDEGHDFTAEPGWADRFEEKARRAAEAWQDPAAWEGNTSLTGNKDGMPAEFIAGILFGECVLHGWDLAAATGQDPDFPPETVRTAWEVTRGTAEMTREYKLFGEEVPVPEDAPLLDRLIGLTGRDPHWKP